MKRCPNCGACQECGHVPNQPWRPWSPWAPYTQPIYPGTTMPYIGSGGTVSSPLPGTTVTFQ